MRLFAGLVPPSEAVEHLADFLGPRLEAGRQDGLRWSPPGQWHVTLAFAPDVDPWRLEDLEQRVAAATARRTPIRLRLAGGGALPDAARAKVVHVRPEVDGDGGAEELGMLARGVRTAFTTSGAEVDGARFRAHLTLARRHRPADVTSWVRLLDVYAGPGFVAEQVTLFASHLGDGPRGRPRHEVLAELPLG